MPTPPIKASTSTKSRQIDVPDIKSGQSANLMAAMANMMTAAKPGREAMSSISAKLQKQTKDQHTKYMKRKK